MTITLIAAMAENRVVGKEGAMPWHLPDDLARFKAITMGHPIIMGRKTFDSIGRPLLGRLNIVLTRQEGYSPEGVAVARTLDEALALAGASGEVFICGGGEVYREALPLADRVHLTVVHRPFEGDTTFPELPADFAETAREEGEGEPPHTFITFERRTVNPRRFSVFLVPSRNDRRWAEGVIAELAARYDAPPFEPHVTVYGGSYTGESELEPVRRALAEAAAATDPITLRVTGLGVTEEYFKTLFVAFEEEPSLRRLHEMVKGAVVRDSGYELVPHLSLLYADMPLEAKEIAASTVFLDREEMRFDEVKIVAPDPVTGWSDARRWQTLFRVRLGGPVEAVRAVLFDYGGVLAEEGFREGLFDLARRQGLDPIAVHGAGMEAVYESGYVLGKGSETAFWRLMRERTGLRGSDRELSALILDRFVLRPWMLELVRSLRAKGYLTAIVSDQTDWLEWLDRRDGFFREFDRVFNSYRLGKGKRDPSIFDDVARELGIAPREALFVDDMLANVVRAESRGMRGIVFDDEARFRQELKRFVEVIPNRQRLSC